MQQSKYFLENNPSEFQWNTLWVQSLMFMAAIIMALCMAKLLLSAVQLSKTVFVD